MIKIRLRFSIFDWDEGNSTKNLTKHRIARHSIEAIFRNGLFVAEDTKHSLAERRYFAVGQTLEGRWLLVVFTIRSKIGIRRLRPISARHMHAKELKFHEKEKKHKGR